MTTFTQFAYCTLLVWLLSATAVAANPVGYIVMLNGPATDFELMRNSKREDVNVNKPLEQGDKIRVLKPSHTEDGIDCVANATVCENAITLLLGNKELITLTHTDKLYKVEHSTAPSISIGFVQFLGKWFTKLQTYQVNLVSLYSKGNDKLPLKLPLLAGGQNQKLIAGKTRLYLAWVGGVPPYRVEVALEGSQEKWIKDKIQGTSVQLDNFATATPGRCAVEVKDAQSMVKGQFEIVTETAILEEAQQAKIAIRQDSPSANQHTLLASWLAQKSEWRLEAYQYVAAIEDFKPALLVKAGLAGLDPFPP